MQITCPRFCFCAIAQAFLEDRQPIGFCGDGLSWLHVTIPLTDPFMEGSLEAKAERGKPTVTKGIPIAGLEPANTN